MNINQIQSNPNGTVRPSIDKLKAEVGGAGDKQLKAVLDKLTAPDTTRKWFEPGACFAAGTLVHTKEGLKPIEQIQVGDYVLSKHDSGTGEQAYKRVLKTFAHPAETVIKVGYAEPGNPKLGNSIICTPNHPIWVAEVGSEDKQPGWTAASNFANNWGGMAPSLSWPMVHWCAQMAGSRFMPLTKRG